MKMLDEEEPPDAMDEVTKDEALLATAEVPEESEDAPAAAEEAPEAAPVEEPVEAEQAPVEEQAAEPEEAPEASEAEAPTEEAPGEQEEGGAEEGPEEEQPEEFPTKHLYQVPQVYIEPYMEGLIEEEREYVEVEGEAVGVEKCTSKTEMPWEDILLPKGIVRSIATNTKDKIEEETKEEPTDVEEQKVDDVS